METLEVFEFGFSPLHADVWSEDSCRRNGTMRLLPAAWRGVKFFLRIFLPRSCGDECGACFVSLLRVGSANTRRIVYNGVQLEETKRKEVAS